MLSNKEYLSAASIDHNYVCIWVEQSRFSHVFFDSYDLVKTFAWCKFVHKKNLSSILDHAMASIAWKGEDDLFWEFLE